MISYLEGVPMVTLRQHPKFRDDPSYAPTPRIKRFRWPWQRRQQHILLVMRVTDMYRVHPQMKLGVCSLCTETVGLYPSGLRAIDEHPDLKLVCNRCDSRQGDQLVPGAWDESSESVPNPRFIPPR